MREALFVDSLICYSHEYRSNEYTINEMSRRRRPYTDQVPPKPMVTLPASTMTGISRSLREKTSIRLSPSGSFKTLM